MSTRNAGQRRSSFLSRLWPFGCGENNVSSLIESTRRLNELSAHMEAQNRKLLDDIYEDENRVRDWELTVIGSDGESHVMPLRCSRKQVRKVKIAIHAAGGDALAVEQNCGVCVA